MYNRNTFNWMFSTGIVDNKIKKRFNLSQGLSHDGPGDLAGLKSKPTNSLSHIRTHTHTHTHTHTVMLLALQRNVFMLS